MYCDFDKKPCNVRKLLCKARMKNLVKQNCINQELKVARNYFKFKKLFYYYTCILYF